MSIHALSTCLRPPATLAVCLLAMTTVCGAADFCPPLPQAPIPSKSWKSLYAADADAAALLYNMDSPAADNRRQDFAVAGDDQRWDWEPPRELSMVSLPTYRIEPPDVLRLEVMKLVPRPPYRIATHDALRIRAIGVLLDQPIDGYYVVQNDGLVTLGPLYGTVRVMGLTTEEATAQIRRSLQQLLQNPRVTVELARSASALEISGERAVAPDGVVRLPYCGAVHVAGKTVAEASQAIQKQLAQYFDSPKVGVTVIGYNSKNYHVIAAGALAGETIRRFPITGNETVLDAISQMRGLSQVSSKTIWVSRPAPGNFGQEQILPVDWEAVAHGGATATNYQILPGDRVYIVDDSLVAINNYMGRLTNPIRRLLNIAALGASTVRTTQVLGRGFNRNRP